MCEKWYYDFNCEHRDFDYTKVCETSCGTYAPIYKGSSQLNCPDCRRGSTESYRTQGTDTTRNDDLECVRCAGRRYNQSSKYCQSHANLFECGKCYNDKASGSQYCSSHQ